MSVSFLKFIISIYSFVVVVILTSVTSRSSQSINAIIEKFTLSLLSLSLVVLSSKQS